MTDKIVSLFGGSESFNPHEKEKERTPNENIIKVFKRALESAEKGNIHAFTLTYRDDGMDGDIVESWASDTAGDLAKLDHAMGIIQHQMRLISLSFREIEDVD